MADKISEIQEILERGIDLRNRRIYFGIPGNDEGDISWSSVEAAVRAVHKMSTDAPTQPIELHVNSGGGTVNDMLRLYDVVQSCPCQVKFFGGGTIASAAVALMAGCDERWLHPHTEIMMHAPSVDIGDKSFVDINIDTKVLSELADKLLLIYEKNSRMPKEFWGEVCNRDTYMTSEEVILLGLADGLVEPKKRGNLRKTRAANLKKIPDQKELQSLVRDIYNRTLKEKRLSKIEVHIPKDEFDNSIVVTELTMLPPENID